jgi:hypothetical protein
MTFMSGFDLSGIRNSQVGGAVSALETATKAVVTLTSLAFTLSAANKITTCASKFFNGVAQGSCEYLSKQTGADKIYGSSFVQKFVNHKVVQDAVNLIQEYSPLKGCDKAKYTEELPKAAVQLAAGIALTVVGSKLFGPAPKVYGNSLRAIGLGFTPHENFYEVGSRLLEAATLLADPSTRARSGGVI